MDNWIDLQDHSNLQSLIHFNEANAKIVIWYQKIDLRLEAMSHSSLLAKNRFRSAVSIDQSVSSPVDEPDKKVDVSTNLFVSLPVSKPNEEVDKDLSSINKLNKEVDVSTDLFISPSVGKPDEKADKDIYLFCYFIENIL